MNRALRFQTLLAGLWAGVIVGIGALAAPALFSVFERAVAGTGAGRIFTFEANLSLAAAVVMYMLERRRIANELAAGRQASVLSGNILLVFAALALTIFGHHVVQPMIQAAKAGQQGALSFGALHGISMVLYWLKALAVVALAWRCTGLRAAP